MKDYNDFWRIIKCSHSKHPSVRFRNHLIVKTVKQILDPLQINEILDVGCGNGDLLKQLSEHLGINGKRIVLSGCDISEYQIEKNRLKRLPFDFWIANLNEKVKINNKFNIIICSEVIEHLENWKTALENIADINKSGGYLIITTQSGNRFKSDYALGHLQHFELDYLIDYLKTLNYEIVAGEKYGFPFYNLQKAVHSIFFSMSREIAHAEANTLTSMLFNITYFLFRISLKSKRLGPQIFILAHKIS